MNECNTLLTQQDIRINIRPLPSSKPVLSPELERMSPASSPFSLSAYHSGRYLELKTRRRQHRRSRRDQHTTAQQIAPNWKTRSTPVVASTLPSGCFFAVLAFPSHLAQAGKRAGYYHSLILSKLFNFYINSLTRYKTR